MRDRAFLFSLLSCLLFAVIPACSPDRELSSVPLIEPPLPGAAPTVANQSVSVHRNESITIIVSGADADGDPLAFSVANTPRHGTLAEMATQGPTSVSVHYTPETDYAGLDEFHVRATDGTRSATGIVKVQILNGTPTANAVSMRIPRTRSSEIPLSGTDPDDDPLSFEILTPPTSGSLGTVINEGPARARVAYTPFPDDGEGLTAISFSYQTSDGSSTSPTVPVALRLNQVPQVPDEGDIPWGISPKDTQINIQLLARDADSDALSFEIEQRPEHGTLAGADAIRGQSFAEDGPALVYTPEPGFVGTDHFIYSADDGLDRSASVVVRITLENAPPTAEPQVVSTQVRTPVEIVLEGGDPNGDALDFSLAQPPQGGVLGAVEPINDTAAQVTYTPSEGFSGEDLFTFTTSDGLAESEPTEVRVVVVNRGPLAEEVITHTRKGTTVNVRLAGSDPDGTELAFEIISPPSNGTLGDLVADGFNAFRADYTPEPGFSGGDQFFFAVDDGTGGRAQARVFIDVTNAPPTAEDITTTTAKNVGIAIPIEVSDPDGDPLHYEVALGGKPGNGTVDAIVAQPDGSMLVSYTPDTDFSGLDIFTLRISDGDGGVTDISVAVSVVNTAPIALPDLATTDSDVAVTLFLRGADDNGDPLDFQIDTPPENGTLGPIVQTSPTTAEVLYTPDPAFDGQDQLLYRTSDGENASPATAFEINVEGSFAYVVTFSGPIAVINLQTNTVSRTIDLGTTPLSVTLTLDGAFAYVANLGTPGSVSVIRTSDNHVVATLPVGDLPRHVSISPDGAFAYVTNRFSNSLSVIRTSDHTIVDTVDLGPDAIPFSMAFSPDGAVLFVSLFDANDQFGDNSVVTVRTSDNTVVGSPFPADRFVSGVEVTPDGNALYVVNAVSHEVTIWDLNTSTVADEFDLSSDSPQDVAITLDGQFALVPVLGTQTIEVIDNTASPRAIVKQIPVGEQPVNIELSPDGQFAYVANLISNNVSVIRISDLTVVDTISVPDLPANVAVMPSN